MQNSFLLFNGKIIPKEELKLGLNRGFRYGDGLFESIRIVNGEVCCLEQHLKRLNHGLQQLKILLTEKQKREIEDKIPELLKINGIKEGGVLRVFVYRSGDGKYSPKSHDAEYLLEAESLDVNLFQINEMGLRIGLTESVKLSSSTFGALKSLSALPYVMAAIEKQERNLDELLLLNDHNVVIEATSSNVFLVFENYIHTPPIMDGCLPGIMRNQLMDLASKNGFKVLESHILEEHLFQAHEVFLSNAIKGIQWVSAYKNKRYFNTIAKQLVGLLNKSYSK